MSDDIQSRRRRAAWRAGHRGTKELDILVGSYAKAHLADMTDEELASFERFLAQSDPELQAWLLAPVPGATDGEFADLVQAVRQFHGLG